MKISLTFYNQLLRHDFLVSNLGIFFLFFVIDYFISTHQLRLLGWRGVSYQESVCSYMSRLITHYSVCCEERFRGVINWWTLFDNFYHWLLVTSNKATFTIHQNQKKDKCIIMPDFNEPTHVHCPGREHLPKMWLQSLPALLSRLGWGLPGEHHLVRTFFIK